MVLLTKEKGIAYSNSSILYQNTGRTRTVLDIPTSIAIGQLLSQGPPTARLYSCKAIDEPWPSTEPKSDAAKAKVLARMNPYEKLFDYGLMYGTGIKYGLEKIRNKHEGDWCLPRHILPISSVRQTKNQEAGSEELPEEVKYIRQEPTISFERATGRAIAGPMRLSDASIYTAPEYDSASHRLVIHNSASPTMLKIKSTDAAYHIPPLSAFFLTNIDYQSASFFSLTADGIFSTPTATAGPGQFDIILLDPPWQNKSVHRSKEYKTIGKSFGEADPMSVLEGMLRKHIAPNGLVACWITNKATIRKRVEEIFERWDLDLIEEWTWLKMTTKGEPVYDIDGVWRKPYERLMLGRKRDIELSSATGNKIRKNPEVIERMIFGVPDVHSRKPCLKALVEQMIPDPTNYRALEIFARNLTAGWWSWGDEVLRFNWEGHWTTEV